MKPKQITIDLNADLGEYQSKNQYFIECQILSHISSCNIACGGHAGDEKSMQKMILACKQKDVAVGAHPSYPDREGFGRRKITIDNSTLKESVINQLRSFLFLSEALNVPISHVKAHGRLYNDAANNKNLADLLVNVINEVLTFCFNSLIANNISSLLTTLGNTLQNCSCRISIHQRTVILVSSIEKSLSNKI